MIFSVKSTSYYYGSSTVDLLQYAGELEMMVLSMEIVTSLITADQVRRKGKVT